MLTGELIFPSRIGTSLETEIHRQHLQVKTTTMAKKTRSNLGQSEKTKLKRYLDACNAGLLELDCTSSK
ncbi:hypothetical protein VTJ04DRAFT_9603 [Mycothermus thermophilus]|uniref:uncharacterized protein n=1 Tax=Humicola insolens TaxID=85995 RepID=UPI003742A68A